MVRKNCLQQWGSKVDLSFSLKEKMIRVTINATSLKAASFLSQQAKLRFFFARGLIVHTIKKGSRLLKKLGPLGIVLLERFYDSLKQGIAETCLGRVMKVVPENCF